MDPNNKYHSSVINFMGDLLHLGTLNSLDEIKHHMNPNSILVGRITSICPLVESSSQFQQENIMIYHLKEVYSCDKNHRQRFKAIFVGDAALTMNNYRLQEINYLAFLQVSLIRNFSFTKESNDVFSSRVLIVGLWSLNDVGNIYYRKKEMDSWTRINPDFGVNRSSSELTCNSNQNPTNESDTQNERLRDKDRVTEVELGSPSKRKKSHDACTIDETAESFVPFEANDVLSQREVPNDRNVEISQLSASSRDISILENIQYTSTKNNLYSDFIAPVSSSPKNINSHTDEDITAPSCSKHFRIDLEESVLCNNNLENGQTVLRTWPSDKSKEDFIIEASLVITLPPISENSVDTDILSFVRGYCVCCYNHFHISCFKWVHENEPICPNCRQEGKFHSLNHKLMFDMILKDKEDCLKTVQFSDKFAEEVLGFSVFELCDSSETRMKAVNFINACRCKEGKENKLLTLKITRTECNNKCIYEGSEVKVL